MTTLNERRWLHFPSCLSILSFVERVQALQRSPSDALFELSVVKHRVAPNRPFKNPEKSGCSNPFH
jgi:hypothetical protein